MGDEKHLIRSEVGAVSDPDGAGTALPGLVAGGGDAARFAYEEFLHGRVRNPHTRRAYERAARRFFDSFGDSRTLTSITPADVGRYLDGLELSDTSKKLHLAARIRWARGPPVRRAGHAARRRAEPGRQRAGAAAVGRGGADAGDHRPPGPHAAVERSHRFRGRAAGPGGDRRADLHRRPHRGRGPAAAAGLLPRRGAVAPALHPAFIVRGAGRAARSPAGPRLRKRRWPGRCGSTPRRRTSARGTTPGCSAPPKAAPAG